MKCITLQSNTPKTSLVMVVSWGIGQRFQCNSCRELMVKIIGKITDNVRMSRIATLMRLLQQAALAYVMITGLAWAQDQETDQAQETGQEQVSEPAAKTIDLQIGMTEEEKVQAEEVLEESGETARGKEAALNEDPEAQRRSQL